LRFLSPALSQLVSAANRLIQGAVAGLTSALFDPSFFLITLFFILRDGERLGAEPGIAPSLPKEPTRSTTGSAGRRRGSSMPLVIVPVVQGILAMIGIWALRTSVADFLGNHADHAATIPLVGSPLVWVPAGVSPSVDRPWWQGIGLLAFGTLVISTSDNVVKPLLLRGTADIHPLLAFFAIVGGILSFGAIGFLVGPALLSVLLSLIHIYRMDILQASPTDPDLAENSTAAPAGETETSP
jgi:predicted PurR-regulated permease PerM